MFKPYHFGVSLYEFNTIVHAHIRMHIPKCVYVSIHKHIQSYYLEIEVISMCDRMAEWSKALVLGTSHFGGVGSNPTPVIFYAILLAVIILLYVMHGQISTCVITDRRNYIDTFITLLNVDKYITTV